MTVRQALTIAAALAALLWGAACGDRENSALGAETDEPLFVQGKQLVKQGRNPEALSSFLKLIDRRGERGAPESHLEAGIICLNHTKDPLEAYHHFRKYLDLQPNSKEASGVRGMVDAARREFARTLSARPLEDQSVRLEIAEELSNLRRERDELRAELAALRGAAPMQVRSSVLSVPEISNPRGIAPPVAKIEGSPITPAPAQKASSLNVAVPNQLTQGRQQSPIQGSPLRPAAPPQTLTKSGRTHTVGAGDTLYKLSKQFGVTIEDIAAANGMSVDSKLKLGASLRIPAPQSVSAKR
jgi:LysM repeat protein